MTNEEKTLVILTWLEKREPGKWWPKCAICGQGAGAHHPNVLGGPHILAFKEPPDLTTPEMFARLLTAMRSYVGPDETEGSKGWLAHVAGSGPAWITGDTPQLALINAVWELAQREKP